MGSTPRRRAFVAWVASTTVAVAGFGGHRVLIEISLHHMQNVIHAYVNQPSTDYYDALLSNTPHAPKRARAWNWGMTGLSLTNWERCREPTEVWCANMSYKNDFLHLVTTAGVVAASSKRLDVGRTSICNCRQWRHDADENENTRSSAVCRTICRGKKAT